MRARTLTALAITLLASATLAQDAKKELEKLQGAWLCVSSEEQGKKVPEDEVKEFVFVIKGNKLSVTRNGRAVGEHTITLDPAKKPAAIYLVDKEGDKNHAIYALEGDSLRLRVNNRFRGNEPDEAPKDFSTKTGRSALLFVLKREKK